MNVLKLKSIRAGTGLTQKSLSKLLNVTLKTYNRKELGIIAFGIDEVINMANILNLSIDQVNEVFFDNKLSFR